MQVAQSVCVVCRERGPITLPDCDSRRCVSIFRRNSPASKYLVNVGPFSLHHVVFPFSCVFVSVGVRHLAQACFLAVLIVALEYCMHLFDFGGAGLNSFVLPRASLVFLSF